MSTPEKQSPFAGLLSFLSNDAAVARLNGWEDEAVKIEAWVRALAALLLAPTGWKLVPIEPTPEMIKAGGEGPQMKAINGVLSFQQARSGYSIDALGKTPETSAIAEVYRAMLAAASAVQPAQQKDSEHLTALSGQTLTGEDAPVHIDIERMERALAGPFFTVPPRLSPEEFDKWIKDVNAGLIPPDVRAVEAKPEAR